MTDDTINRIIYVFEAIDTGVFPDDAAKGIFSDVEEIKKNYSTLIQGIGCSQALRTAKADFLKRILS